MESQRLAQEFMVDVTARHAAFVYVSCAVVCVNNMAQKKMSQADREIFPCDECVRIVRVAVMVVMASSAGGSPAQTHANRWQHVHISVALCTAQSAPTMRYISGNHYESDRVFGTCIC
jgi:uncharacterized protein (DUF983 family)